jgi:hypothetical protein
MRGTNVHIKDIFQMEKLMSEELEMQFRKWQNEYESLNIAHVREKGRREGI